MASVSAYVRAFEELLVFMNGYAGAAIRLQLLDVASLYEADAARAEWLANVDAVRSEWERLDRAFRDESSRGQGATWLMSTGPMSSSMILRLRSKRSTGSRYVGGSTRVRIAYKLSTFVARSRRFI